MVGRSEMRLVDWGFNLATMCFVYCAALEGQAAFAQSLLPRTARIVGHVICADTRAPARLASIILQPVPTRTAKGEYRRPNGIWESQAPPTYSVMTDTHGAFEIEHLEAGSYYVVADPGT
jgi:hypothetical protein